MGKQLARTLPIVTLAIVSVVMIALIAVLAPWQPGRAAAPPLLATVAGAPAAALHTTAQTAANTWSSQGAVVTQTFALHGGWNTIYLEVEPINPSPLADPDGAGPLLPTHTLSSMEAIFAQLDAQVCLESVWTWNVPTTQVDYIIDPAEGLWDEPGWKQYIPAGKPDAFLTDLLSLRANTGYLVQLKEGANATLTVTGTPVVRKHRWVQESYNLAGFPILEGSEPTRAAFFDPSPITEVFALDAGGEWTLLAASAKLAPGQAYLVYYGGPNAAAAATDYTAPLFIQDLLGDGLRFGAGAYQQSVMLQSLATIATPIKISLLQGSDAGVAIQLTAPISKSLQSGDATFNLPAGGAQRLDFAVLTADQRHDGAALIEISAPALGVRWRVPVAAKAGSKAGLWVGDVTVTAVSEALGATNIASNTLTVGLRARSDDQISGATEVHDSGAGLQMTITLALPAAGSTTPLDSTKITGTLPAVGGYVFWDANQNGQRDGDEVGLAGLSVTLGGAPATTAADGSYLFQGLAPGDYPIAMTPPPNYTTDFLVTLPLTPAVTSANAVPVAVSLSAAGIESLAPVAYVRQALLVTDQLPYFDDDDNRIEPVINFGLAPIYVAELVATGPGGCADVLATPAPVKLGDVKNGFLGAAPAPGTLANLLQGSYAVRVRAGDLDLACGELAESASTQDPFRFRILLRVATDDAKPELLPYYEIVTDTQRISAVSFSMTTTKSTTGGSFRAGGLQRFEVMTSAANDPLNPFKHKYHPDHDNLDSGFLPLPANLDPYRWESPAFTRRIELTLENDLRAMPGMAGLSAEELQALVVEVDWGGGAWGGHYKEVISGVHKNDITVEGTFVIRQVLTGAQLRKQPFDQ